MRHNPNIILAFILPLFVWSCSLSDKSEKCEPLQEWMIQDYKIVKLKCPDRVLAFYYSYEVYEGNKRKGNGVRFDSCVFTCQSDNENFLIMNVCDNSIKRITPEKTSLDSKSIDSVTIFSNEFKQTQLLTRKQIDTFAQDWNNSKTHGYFNHPFDSAFYRFPAYQYKLTVFSKGIKRTFYGYNYLILDSSNWEFEMSKELDLKYMHRYWKK